MINVPMKTRTAFTKQTVLSINQLKITKPLSSETIMNLPKAHMLEEEPVISQRIPHLTSTTNKGQRVPLESSNKLTKIKVCLGWNVTNSSCDVDVSAFLLDSTGKVIGDNWFVFYGQTESPDHSTIFSMGNGEDREIISVDFTKIHSNVSKLVFVLTINEALEKRLNFSMIQDAYIRILDATTNTEIVSFMMDEYYENVTSMMIGELYLHNHSWKFHAIGNGVARDLAGLCEFYGVEIE